VLYYAEKPQEKDLASVRGRREATDEWGGKTVFDRQWNVSIFNLQFSICNFQFAIRHVFLFALAVALLSARGPLPAAEEEKATIEPGDVLDILVPQYDDFSKTYSVDENGAIFVKLLGEVPVEGLTPTQVATLLEEKLSAYLTRPEGLVVRFQERKRRVRVMGCVTNPGWYDVPYPSSVQEAIAQAGGYREGAVLEEIVVTRRVGMWVEEIPINLPKMLRERKPLPTLRNKDEVFVPEGKTPGETPGQAGTATPGPPTTPGGEGMASPPGPAPAAPTGPRVSVLGAVEKEGKYDLGEEGTLLTVMAEAGGFRDEADLSAIRLIHRRENNRVEFFDLQAYLDGEVETGLPLLGEGDVIWVPRKDVTAPPRKIHVRILGQVRNPGTYEIERTMNLQEAIQQAGGAVDDADLTKVTVRHPDQEVGEATLVDLQQYLIEGDEKRLPKLQEGDVIFVSKTVPPAPGAEGGPGEAGSRVWRIEVLGVVQRPGEVEVREGTSLQGALTQAGGPGMGADLARVVLARRVGGELQRQTVNLERFMQEGDVSQLPPLQEGDLIFVPQAQPQPRRTQAVNVFGEVVRPQAYEVAGLAGGEIALDELLAMAGGPTETADLEHIKIIRPGDAAEGRVSFYDLAAYQSGAGGELPPRLRPGETVVLEKNVVHVLGAVATPGQQTVPFNATVVDAISRAGGPTENADLTRIKITRRGEAGQVMLFDLERYVQSEGQDPIVRVKAGDVITLEARPAHARTVYLLGQVARPGAYEMAPDTSLQDLLFMGGGPAEGADLTRLKITHATEGGPRSEYVNMKAHLEGADATPLPKLSPGDIVTVDRVPVQDRQVYVFGQVTRPGAYPITPGETDLLQLLGEAGGPAEGAHLERVKIVRHRDGREERLAFNLQSYLNGLRAEPLPVLQAGDIITIGGNVVHVLGAVRNPGTVTVAEQATPWDVLVQVGGPTEEADTRQIQIVRKTAAGEQLIPFDLEAYRQGDPNMEKIILAHEDTLLVARKKPRRETWRQALDIISGLTAGAALLDWLKR